MKPTPFFMMLALGAGMIATGCSARPAAKADGKPDMSELAAQVDTNHDGRMSREEWQAAGLPMSSFNGFEAGRGYVTLHDYQVHDAPPGIDINGDGKVTVAEFQEFDRRMAAGQGAAGKGGPPPSGAPGAQKAAQ